MKQKFFSVLLIFIFCVYLSSCGDYAKKDTAYCFSAVFDKKDGNADITLYCRIPSKSQEDGDNDTATAITLTGKTLGEALENGKFSGYEIYYNSMKAIFFTKDISKDFILETASELYNNTKYQTSVRVYTNSEKEYSLDEIHSLASTICSNKGINEEEKSNYLNLTRFIRKTV